MSGLDMFKNIHSNDITNPVQRLFATTIEYLLVVFSFHCKYVAANPFKQKKFQRTYLVAS